MIKKAPLLVAIFLAVILATSTINGTMPFPAFPIPPLSQVNAQTEEFARIAVVGDVDCKSGQTKQFDLIVKMKADYFFSGGDYAYGGSSGGKCVLDNLKTHGFSPAENNFAMSCGNHDSCTTLREYQGLSKNYGSKFFEDAKIAAHIFDGNSGFGTGSAQYTAMKKELESSDAWYNFVLIHQPFATAKSDHGPNGGFDAWQPIFKANGVNMVLQAHNHNDQRFNIDGVGYTVNGGGYHDTGSNLYPIDSKSFKTFPLLFGNDEQNAVLFLDVQINDPDVKKIKGQLIGADEKVLDTFTIEGDTTTPPEPCPPNMHRDPATGQCVQTEPEPEPEPPTGEEGQVQILDVTASTFQAPNAPNNTIDGDLETRWSADGDPQIISYQFNDTWDVNNTAIAFYKGDTRTASFEINGQSFLSSGATNELQNFSTNVENTSSLTITGHGNSDNTWNSITEVKFFGQLTNATEPPEPPQCGPDEHLENGICVPNPPPPQPSNETFTVDVGSGIATFVPENPTEPTTTVNITAGNATLPKPIEPVPIPEPEPVEEPMENVTSNNLTDTNTTLGPTQP